MERVGSKLGLVTCESWARGDRTTRHAVTRPTREGSVRTRNNPQVPSLATGAGATPAGGEPAGATTNPMSSRSMACRGRAEKYDALYLIRRGSTARMNVQYRCSSVASYPCASSMWNSIDCCIAISPHDRCAWCTCSPRGSHSLGSIERYRACRLCSASSLRAIGPGRRKSSTRTSGRDGA